jgi:hypothetical protein
MKIETLEALIEAAKNMGVSEVKILQSGRDGEKDTLLDCSATLKSYGPQMDIQNYLVIKNG